MGPGATEKDVSLEELALQEIGGFTRPRTRIDNLVTGGGTPATAGGGLGSGGGARQSGFSGDVAQFLMDQLNRRQTGVSGAGVDPVAAASGRTSGGTSGGAGSPGNAAVNDLTAQQIEAALRNPSAFNNEEVMNLYNRLGMNIDDQFAQEERSLRNEMARRGLADSSIQGGRLSDLNVGRRQARTELADRLATARAQDFANARAQAIGMGQQQRQNLFGEEMGRGNLDINRGQLDISRGQLDVLRDRFGLDQNQQNFLQNMGYLDRYTQFGQQAFENDLRQADFNRMLQTDQDQMMLRLLGLGA